MKILTVAMVEVTHQVAGAAMVEVTGQQGQTIASSVAAQAIGLETVHWKVVAAVHVQYPPLLDQGMLEVVPVGIVMVVTIGTWMINMIEGIMLIGTAMIAEMIDMEAVIELLMTGVMVQFFHVLGWCLRSKFFLSYQK